MAAPAAPLAGSYRATPLWWDDGDLRQPAPVAVPAEADVVIIGGGYTGLAAALELSRRGRSTVVLERETVAWGASSRNGGMVHPGGKHPIDEVLAMPNGRALWDVTVDAFEGIDALVRELSIDCAWRRGGHLELAHHPRMTDGLRRTADAYNGIGEDAAFVPRDELADEIGSGAYYGGLRVARSGSVHPACLAGGLARGVVAAGAAVCEQSPARAIERDGAGFCVQTPHGVVRAGDVVVATNGYTGDLVPWLHRRVLSIGSYIIATEPISADLAASVSPKGRMFFDTKNFLWYWRLSPDGRRVVFGGRTSFAPTTVDRAKDALYRAMVRVHPQLTGVRVERAWGGNVALTFDRMPHIGRHPSTGVVYAMGYCGTGVAMAIHFGRAIGR